MNKSTFEEEISKTGKLIYTSVGNSMMPIIRENCDILIIEKVSGRLKKYDIPLYKSCLLYTSPSPRDTR